MGGVAFRSFSGRQTAYWGGHMPGGLDALWIGFPAGWYIKQNFSDAKAPQFLWDEEWVRKSVESRVEWEKAAEWDPETMRAGLSIRKGEYENPVPLWKTAQ